MKAYTHIDRNNRYTVQRGLGKGSSGEVYLAYDNKVGRPVAIKMLSKECLESAQANAYRDRFLKEAHALAALKHPSIIEIYDIDEALMSTTGKQEAALLRPYYVMEYIPNPSLSSLIKQKRLNETVLVAIALELTSALRHVHDQGMLHRDIKPENTFIDAAHGRVILADFGLVKTQTSSPKTTDVLGTPGFMSPEQLEGGSLSVKSDIFGLGALLYYLATGEMPYPATSPYQLAMAFRQSRPKPLCDKRADISDNFSRLIQDCLEVSSAHRPQSMGDVHQSFLTIFSQLKQTHPRDVISSFFGQNHEPSKASNPGKKPINALSYIFSGLNIGHLFKKDDSFAALVLVFGTTLAIALYVIGLNHSSRIDTNANSEAIVIIN